MGVFHKPVLLQSVCEALQVKPGQLFIDATLGGGGHTRQIIARGGEVLGLDQDPEALSACPDLDHLVKVRSNFTHLEEVARQSNWAHADGIIFDLGVSGHQLDTPARGFSFQSDGPLDMRMDPDLAVTAADLINHLSDKQLAEIFYRFGQEKMSRSLAKKIVSARPVYTTGQLAGILPNPDTRRRIFQALRIAVNDELGSLSAALPQALDLLNPGGRLVVISFHSLEDRLVKQQFSAWEKAGLGLVLTPKPVRPEVEEIEANSRSKSSKLRIFVKHD